MAKKSLSGNIHKEAVPKRTSVGHGRRKRGSFSVKGEKKYRGQGKG
jgi:hypothetical protein